MQEAIAYGTLMMTVGLVLSLPRLSGGRHIGHGGVAAGGVLVLLTTGVVSLTDLVGSFQVLWRPFVAVLSIMLTTSVALRFGIIDYFARWLEPRPGQPLQLVFCFVFVFSAAASAVLNNDAAVLLLTPLIVGLVRRNYPDQPDLLVPFAFAVFSAAGVAPLVISNPMNLIVTEVAGIGFNEYAARMIPISLAGWLTAYAVLRLIFRRQLDSTEKGKITILQPVRLSRTAKQFIGFMVVALGCYPVISYAGGAVWAVAAVSAAVGVWLSWRHNIASPRRLAAGLSWQILIFLFCVFVIVLGLRNVGLVDRITALYSSAIGPAAKVAVIGISSAIGSAVMNNHPMAILNALAIGGLPEGKQPLILAALIGGDLGPRLLPMGSLAGLLWLDSLRRQGIYISISLFILVGLLVTIPSLGLSLLILFLTT